MDHVRHEMYWIDDLSAVPGLPLPEGTFCVLLACDALGVSVDAVSDAIESLLERGMAYLCSWGPDCERVHDITDSPDRGQSRQRLVEADEWARLTDDAELARAIRRTDGRIRQWNEQVAGDDSSREVRLEYGDPMDVFGTIAECASVADDRFIALARGTGSLG